MGRWSVEQVSAAIRASWSLDTCDPADAEQWSSDNRARGQCGVSSLVLHDLVGGELMLAEVLHRDGSRQGWHYWNRLPDGTELDLTREQFTADEIVQEGSVVARPPGPPRRCAEQYLLLRERVLAELLRTRTR